MNLKKVIFIILVSRSCFSLFLFSNNTEYLTNTFIENKTALKNSELKKAIEGWGEIKLGMNREEVKEVIKNSYPYLSLKEDLITDFIEEDSNFLETYSQIYINKMQFQFNQDDKLFLLRVQLSPLFYSFSGLVDELKVKYGENFTLKFGKAIWENAEKKMELYKDNTIVYLSKEMIEEAITTTGNTSFIEEEKENQQANIIDNL